MHQAAIDVQKAMKKIKKENPNYYILKMDIKKYFNHIDKKILFEILKKGIKDNKLLWLIKQILLAQNKPKGIEIGNYTSQTFANIYLNEIDQYVTKTIKVKNYFRYMDDTIVLLNSKQEAKEILEKMKQFLEENLALELNTKTQIFKGKQGVNFCGYKINEQRMKVRSKGKKKFKKKTKKLFKQIKENELSSKEARNYLTGHFGYFKIANVYDLQSKNHIIREEEIENYLSS